ncbi:MAG: twin-arginine translocation signal domain-containing protein [Spirochaetaceae bacterium]|nr:MAG: twin-arginine translocation signal domain-containing protein [Spirochaetaceae bacterium]
MTKIDRRAFIKYSSAVGAAAALATTGVMAAAQETVPGQQNGRMALLMDNSLCVNCQACRVACQNENSLPVREKYIRFDHVDGGTWPNVTHHVNRHSCQHCADAPCVEICPVEALFKGPEGFTHMDFEACIGCGACQMVCPFDVPMMSEDPASGDPKMYKCTACRHLVSEGRKPACATTCITNAVDYGPWHEMLSKAEKRVAVLRKQHPQANVYGRTQQDGLGLLLILRTPAEDYPHLV